MINTPQDYQLVTPVGQIDGGILPARDVAADGSAHALRTEDLCFATEAVRERDLYGSISTTTSLPSHVLRAADWERLWFVLRKLNYGDGAFDQGYPRAVAYAEPFYDIPYTLYTGSVSTELSEHYPNAYAASCFGSVANHGNVVDETSMWRGFFFDLLRADRVQIGPSFFGSYQYVNSTGHSSTYTVANETRSPIGPYNHLQEIAYDQAGSAPNERLRSTQFGVTAASIYTSVPLSGIVTSAKLVALYTLWVQPEAGYKTGAYYYFTRAFNVSVAGGSIAVPNGFFLTQADFDIVSVCGTLGQALPPSIMKTSSWNNTGAWVQCPRTFLVVDYNFRTEIRSVNWQWTP